MAILSLKRDYGVDPSIVRMNTNDTLATMTAAGYLESNLAAINAINGGPFQWADSDLVLCYYQPTATSFAWVFLTTTNNFTVLAPFVPVTGVTPQQVQQSAFNFGVAAGAANNYNVSLSPTVVTPTGGMFVSFTSNYANTTGTPTLTIDGGTPIVIRTYGGQLAPNDIVPGTTYYLLYNSTSNAFDLLNPTTTAANTFAVQGNLYNYSLDSGSVNAYEAILTPPAHAPITGGFSVILDSILFTNTGPSTLSVNTDGVLSTEAIVLVDGSALVGGEILLDSLSTFIFSESYGAYVLMDNALIASPDVTPTQVQQAVFNNGTDTGTADAYLISLNPTVASLTNGLIVSFTPAHNNLTTTPTLGIGLITPQNIVKCTGALVASDIVTTEIAYLIWSSAASAFILLNPATGFSAGGVTAAQVQQSAFNVGIESGSGTTYVVTLSPAISSYTDGLIVMFKPIHPNTVISPTLNVNGLGAISIVTPYAVCPGASNQVLAHNDLNPSQTAICVYDHSAGLFVLQNPYSTLVYGLMNNGFIACTDAGTTNAYSGNTSIINSSYTQYPVGSTYIMYAMLNTNTGASTVDFGLATNPAIVTPNGSALVGGEIVAGRTYYFLRNANNQMVLLNSSLTVTSGIVLSEQILTSGSGTYTPTTGAQYIWVRGVAGGGQGGGCTSTTSQVGVGGGGGAGAYGEYWGAAASLAYSIGVGGTTGTAGNTGQAGTATTFGTAGAILNLAGGAGGAAANAITSVGFAAGGSGGAATTATLKIAGQTAPIGYGTLTAALGGMGASSPLGGGGSAGNADTTASVVGGAGQGYGSGGGGSACGGVAGSAAGGVAANGVLIITEYT